MKYLFYILLFGLLLLFCYPRTAAHAEPQPTSYGEFPVSATPRDLVQEVFGEKHIMVKVAGCESTYKQFTKTGELIRDHVTGDHVGLFQISLSLHAQDALHLGMDIHTTHGNVHYAKRLYDLYGLQPWLASRSCWEAYLTQSEK